MSGNPTVEMRMNSFSGSLKSPCGSATGSNRGSETMNRRRSNPDSTSDSEGTNTDLVVRISGPVITDLLYKLHRRSATLVDTHVICKDGYIPVHRCVLIASSKVLREHLLNEDPADLASVCLPDFLVSQVLPLLNSFYTGSTLFKKSELNTTLELISLLQADASISYSFQPAKEADKKWTPKMRHYLETTHAHAPTTSEVSENVIANQSSEDSSGQKDCEPSAPIVEQVCGNYSLEEESTSASAVDGEVGAADGDGDEDDEDDDEFEQVADENDFGPVADENEFGHVEDENEKATDDEGTVDDTERDQEENKVEDETKSIFEKLESMDVEVSNIGVDIEEVELSEGEYECEDDGVEDNDNASNGAESLNDAHVIELSPERTEDYGKDPDDSHSLPDSPDQSYCHFSDDDYGDSPTVDLVNNVIIRPDVHREHFSHQEGMPEYVPEHHNFEDDNGGLEDGTAEKIVLTEGQNCIEIETTTFDENGECTQIAQIITETIPRNIFEKYHGPQHLTEEGQPYVVSKPRKNSSRSRRGSSVSKTSSEDSFKCPLPPMLFTRKVKKPKVTAATKAAEVRNRKEEILFSMQLEEEIRKSFEQAQLELLMQSGTSCERYSEDETESVATSNGSEASNNLEDGVQNCTDLKDSAQGSTTLNSSCDGVKLSTDVITDDLLHGGKKLKRSAHVVDYGEDQLQKEDGGQVSQAVHSPPADQRKSCIVSNTRMKSKGEIKALPPVVNVSNQHAGPGKGVHPLVEVSDIESHKSEEEEFRTSVNDSIRRLEDLLHKDVIEDDEPESGDAEKERVGCELETDLVPSTVEVGELADAGLQSEAVIDEEPEENEEELEYRRQMELEQARIDEERKKLEMKAREEELERRRLEEEKRIEEELNRQVELNMEMQKSEPENFVQASSSLIQGISDSNRTPKSTKFYEDFVKKKLRVLQAAEELKRRQAMSECGDVHNVDANDLLQEDCDPGFQKTGGVDANLDRFEIVDYIPDAENEIVVENEEVIPECELSQDEGKSSGLDTYGYESSTNLAISESEVSCTVSKDLMKIRLTKKKKLKVKEKHTQTKPPTNATAKPDSKTLVPNLELPKACSLMTAAQTLLKNPARRLEAQHNGKRYVIENPKIVIGKHDLLNDEDKKKYRLRLKNLKRSIQRQRSKQRADTPPPTLTKAITSPKASTSTVPVLVISSKPKERSKEHKLLEKKSSKDDGCPPRLEPAYADHIAHGRAQSTNGGHSVAAASGLVENFPIASQPAFISSENLDWYQKALRKCAHCKRKYRTHSKASSCLANHGFRRCLICLDLVPSYDTMYEQHNYKFHEASKKGHVACPICGHLFTVSGLTTHVTRKHLKAESDTQSRARYRPEVTEAYEQPVPFVNTKNDNPQSKLNSLVNDVGKRPIGAFHWDSPFKPVGRVHLSESDDEDDDDVFQDKQPNQHSSLHVGGNGIDQRTKFSLESLYAFKLHKPYDASVELENRLHQALIDFILAQKAFGLEPSVEVATSPEVCTEACTVSNELSIMVDDDHKDDVTEPEPETPKDVIPDSPLDLQVSASVSRKNSCSSPVQEDALPEPPADEVPERTATPVMELQNIPASQEPTNEPVTTDSPLSTSLSRTSSHEEIHSPVAQRPRTPTPKPESPPAILRPVPNEASTPSPETTIQKIISATPPIPASSPTIPSFFEIDKIPVSEPDPTPNTSTVDRSMYEPMTSRQESNTPVNPPVTVPQHFDLQSYSTGHSMISEASSVITSHQSSKRHDPHPITEIVQPKKRYLHLQQYGGPTANAMDYSRGYFSYPQSFTSLHSSSSASSHYSNAQDYRHNPMTLHHSSHDSLSQHIIYPQSSSSQQFPTPHLSHSSHHGSSSYHSMIHHHHSHQTHPSHHGHQYRHQSSYGGRNHSDKSSSNSITMDESGSLICELNPVTYTASPIPIPRQSYNYGSSNAPKPLPPSAFDSLANNAESTSSRPSRSIFSTPPLSSNTDNLSVNNPIGYTTYNPSQEESSYRRTQHQSSHASSNHGHHLSSSSSQHSQSHQHQALWESHSLRNLETTSLSLMDYADDLDDGPNDGTIRCERCRRCFYPAEFQAHNCS